MLFGEFGDTEHFGGNSGPTNAVAVPSFACKRYAEVVAQRTYTRSILSIADR